MVISENKYKEVADKIGCEVAVVKAVVEVESMGEGFLKNGFPKILFEPHIFWKELRKVGITPIISDICYPKWGTKPYGKVTDQPNRLERASKIHRESALKSCSWGLFQICGFNYKQCGCNTLQEFVNRMCKSEDEQLDLFSNYIIKTMLDDELKGKDWKGFARQYNGAAYAKNAYHIKLEKAYKKYKV